MILKGYILFIFNYYLNTSKLSKLTKKEVIESNVKKIYSTNDVLNFL